MALPEPIESRRAPTLNRRAIDDAIRVIPADWFRPSPAIYWTDFLASASIGWAAFILAVGVSGFARAALVTVAGAALYRAVLFIHEITHQSPRDVPGFSVVWNVTVGVPLLIPSFLYEHVHTDHHRQRFYGTASDPEYVPFGRRPPSVIAKLAAASLLAPAAFSFRFGVLAPVSWMSSPVRRWTLAHASALLINHRYVRTAPMDARARAEEFGACLVVWTIVVLRWAAVVPAAVIGFWICAVAALSGLNAIRTLAAHRYDRDTGELSMTEQLVDSCTLTPGAGVFGRLADVGRTLVAPVGLRYHALHHWIPSLPYHNLGRAHRLLAASLPAGAPYRRTDANGISAALRDLFHRARHAST